MNKRPHLLFVSTRFLFPVDSGGKIRTTQILRGMKGGDFRITLVSPATEPQRTLWRDDLDSVCDEFVHWPEPRRWPGFHFTRLRYVAHTLPVPIRTDANPQASSLIESILERDPPDIVVYDFLHAAVLLPASCSLPKVLFTHNVESEIFRRHLEHADNPATKWLWRNQLGKMQRFEKEALRKFAAVVAVSERDRQQFIEDFEATPDQVHLIPTGVDLDFFAYDEPSVDEIIFIGSMDWLPNQDAMRYFMDDVWPLLTPKQPNLAMVVVGRNPPASLVAEAQKRGLNWSFTGFVDDIRPHTKGRRVAVVPIRIGGGTRLKAYEAMAMGNVMVSTTVGVEGLPIVPDEHYICADTPQAMAEGIDRLVSDPALCQRISLAARRYVEDHFSFQVAADTFTDICSRAMHEAGQ